MTVSATPIEAEKQRQIRQEKGERPPPSPSRKARGFTGPDSKLERHVGSHPSDEGLLGGNLKVPQVQVSPLGAHGHGGGVRGMPLQAGDPAVERAGGAVEVVRRQRANKRLLQTLQRESGVELDVLQVDTRTKCICTTSMYVYRYKGSGPRSPKAAPHDF